MDQYNAQINLKNNLQGDFIHKNGNSVSYDGTIMLLAHRLTEETTAHGIPHIVRARGKWWTSVWVLISLVMVGTWIFHSHYTITQFLKKETNVKIAMISAQQLPFPAVTVCNKNAFKKTILDGFITQMVAEFLSSEREERYPPWIASMFGATTDNPDGNEAMASSTNPSQLGEDIVQLATDAILMAGSRYNLTIDNFTHNEEDFIIACFYDRTPCEQIGVEVRKIYNWLFGHCYVFNPLKGRLMSTKTGPRFGLKLQLNIQQDEYNDFTEAAGIRILIHDQYEMPFPENDGHNVPPGVSASIGVKLITVSRLGGGYSDCFNTETEQEKPNVFKKKYQWTGYNSKTCLLTCYQQKLENICSCTDIRYPSYQNSVLRSCTENTTVIWNPNDIQIIGKNPCYESVQTMVKNQSLNCEAECSIPCKENSYLSSVSYSLWPSKSAEESVKASLRLSSVSNRTLEKDGNIFNNFLEANIYFEDFNYNDVTETPAIMLSECLSDLGGNMGMYIGASLFTFFEFFQFFFQALIWICTQSYRKSNVKEKNSKNERFKNELTSARNVLQSSGTRVNKISVQPANTA